MSAAFNPDTKTEIVGGLARTGLFIGGTILNAIGFVIAGIGRLGLQLKTLWILGDLIWLTGAAMIIAVIVMNLKGRTAEGFRIANTVMKIVVLLFSAILMLLVNFG